MRDLLDVHTVDMFELERAQAIFEMWIQPFLEDESNTVSGDECVLSQ